MSLLLALQGGAPPVPDLILQAPELLDEIEDEELAAQIFALFEDAAVDLILVVGEVPDEEAEDPADLDVVAWDLDIVEVTQGVYIPVWRPRRR